VGKDGWIKVHRRMIESDIFCWKPAEWLKIWLYILLKVNHSDGSLPRGTAYFSKDWEDAHVSKWQWHKCVKYLKRATMIATEKATHGYIIKVLKYNNYQELTKKPSNTQSNTLSNSGATQKQHRSNSASQDKRTKPSTEPLRMKECKNVRIKIIDPLDNIMNKYQKKFPEQRKLFGVGGIAKARDYFEGCHMVGWTWEDIFYAIEKAKIATPWKIITLSDKKSKAYAKEWEELVKKKKEEHDGHHT